MILSEPSTVIDDAKHCTILPTTPTLLRALPDPEEYSKIRTIFLGGESSSPELIRKWWTPCRKLWNTYGPTEATIAVTIAELRPEIPVTLGRPIKDSQVILLDSDLNESSEGEICIAGQNLALGYYKNCTQTEEKFVQWKCQRIYRTGDLARRSKYGMVFLGRKDQMVKNRGFLINMEEEVVPILLMQPGVVSAAAVMYRQRLIAFVTPADLDAEQMRRSISEQYDQFLAPDEIVLKHQLRQTTNGKVDNRALTEELMEREQEPSEQESSNPKFDIVRAAVAKTLGISTKSLNIECSFAQVGGNSLLAIKLLSLLRQNGLSISFESLFLLPRLSDMVGFLQESLQHADEKDDKDVSENGLMAQQRPVPMTNAQKGMIRSTINEPPAGYMVISISLHMSAQETETLDLRGAWKSILANHSVFRASFDIIDGLMEVAPEYEHHWEMISADTEDVEGMIPQESVALLEIAKSKAIDRVFRPVNAFRLISGQGTNSVLLWMVHHALIDGWSMSNIVKDVRSRLKGENIPQRVQFPSYCVPLPSHLDQVHQSARCFWSDSMTGLLDGTELKVCRPENIQLHEEFGDQSLGLGMSLSQVEVGARSFDVSPAVIIYSAWALLLSNYAAKDEVVFGAVFSGRNFPVSNIEEIVGPLINTCPFPVRMPKLGSKADFLSYVQALLLRISEYQWSASEILQEIAHGSHSKIFDTVVFLEYDLPEFANQSQPTLPAWTYHRTDVPEFGLTLQVQNIRGELVFRALYNKSSYGSTIISRMLVHFRNLCIALMHPTTQTVSDICDRMLEPSEFLRLVRNSTSYFAPFSGPTTLKEAFEQGVDQWPDVTAIESQAGAITYTQLEEVTNLVAKSISDIVSPQTVVALLGDGSLNWLIGVLAIIKAGAVYLPLDTKLPIERMENMINTSSATLCIFPNEDCLQRFSSIQTQKLLLHELRTNTPSGGPDERLTTTSKTDDYAYVMFTSGSTGTPKGIKVTHRATLSHLSYEPARMHARPTRRHAQIFSPGFDVNIAEIFGTLCYGATLVLKDAGDPFAHLRRVNATMITPSLLSVLSPTDLKNLDTIYLIGEAVPQSLSDRWSEGRTLYNFYGPCECTIAALYTRLQPGRPVTLGRTIPRVGAYVLDARGRPAPVGVMGEICLSGVQVMEGYIGKGTEAITKRVFGPDPFNQGQRMYRTGDMGVWTESMELRFLGRVDHQVKVRGYRVELDEIEQAIRSADSVITQVAVVVSKETIYAFVAPETVDTEKVRKVICRQLPSYACPQRILALSRLPTTPNQKLDGKALSAMVKQEPTSNSKSKSKSASKTEQLLEMIWREAIGLLDDCEIAPEDDFLALGGNSLRQITAAQKVCSKLGLRIPLGIFIRNTRMAALTKALDEYCTSQRSSPTIQPLSFLGSLMSQTVSNTELSYLEKELYNMHQQSYTPSSFNVSHEIQFYGSVNLADLERAIQIVVSQNKILQTNFEEINGNSRRTKLTDTFHVLLYRGLADKIVEEQINTPFDLASDQLTRIALIEEASGARMILVQHHIITDQVSARLFMKKIGQVYSSLLSGVDPSLDLPQTSPSYAAWAHWRDSQTWCGPASEQASFWKSQFAALATSPFGHHTAQALLRQATHSSPFVIPHLISPPTLELFLAATTLAFHRVFGSNDLVVGIPFIDRTEPGTDEMLGLFLDRLPIRLRTDNAIVPTIGELTASARSAVQKALAHALPYQHIRDITGNDSLFEVMLVFNRREDRIDRDLCIEGVTSTVVPRRAPGAKFPLLVEFTERDEGIVCELEYFEDVLSSAAAGQICDQIQHIVGL